MGSEASHNTRVLEIHMYRRLEYVMFLTTVSMRFARSEPNVHRRLEYVGQFTPCHSKHSATCLASLPAPSPALLHDLKSQIQMQPSLSKSFKSPEHSTTGIQQSFKSPEHSTTGIQRLHLPTHLCPCSGKKSNVILF